MPYVPSLDLDLHPLSFASDYDPRRLIKDVQ